MNMTEKLAAFSAATNNELFDVDLQKDGTPYGWQVEAVETHETLEMWEESSKGWNERTAMKTGEIAGFPFRAWKSAQAVKGQPRQSMSVVDLGDVRIALPGTDLTVFRCAAGNGKGRAAIPPRSI